MTTFGQIQKAWLPEFERLQKLFHRKTAAPFLSVRPRNYDPKRVPSILYVGRATDCDWYLKEFRKIRTASFLVKKTSDFINDPKKTHFWAFAGRLSESAANRTRHNIKPLQNLLWTNLYKVGALRGNPNRALCREQRALAVETLSREIREYKPRLIVFAMGDWEPKFEEILDGIFKEEKLSAAAAGFWDKSGSESGYWLRRAQGRVPAILWTGHPQGARRRDKDAWLHQACALL